MTEEIDGYKDDLERQIATLRENLTKLDKAKDDRRGNIIAGLEGLLADAKASYGSFSTAYREIDKTLQPKYQPIGSQFKKDLDEITNSLKAAKNAQDRKDLNLADDQRTTAEILDEAKKIQDETKESAIRSKQILKEIQDTGNATMDQLVQDRAKIENVHNDLEEMDSDLKLAQNQLKSIARKLTKDKIIRGLCILALLIALTAVIVVIVKRKTASGSTDKTT